MSAPDGDPWVDAGLAHLTGSSDGPGVVPAGGLGEGLRRLGSAVGVDGARCAAARAAVMGLRRRGRISASGGARVVEAADGLVVVNLPRRDDVESIEAWLGEAPGADPWRTVEGAVARWSAAEVVDRAQLLGIAAAVAAEPDEIPAPPAPVVHGGGERPPTTRAHVVDLSALWAGPLCAQVLRRAGHHVTKVETGERPDGARYGPAAFFRLLNDGKDERVVRSDELASVVADADVVVTSSRRRALEQLGIDPFEHVARFPGAVWVAITGYGLTGPCADHVAFGDDAAAAAGLVHLAGGVFAADALADPAAGLAGAAAALGLLRAGRGGVVDVSLRGAARALVTSDEPRREIAAPPAPGGAPW